MHSPRLAFHQIEHLLEEHNLRGCLTMNVWYYIVALIMCNNKCGTII
uniref:Uncharacterized protein n=1 Tax=Heterorhabditis bacteriophora TaxID=37862 RepID=A0A1I7WPK7_HETBA